MSDSFIPLLQFFATVDEVVGRKKCQKLIHILQECGCDFGFNFKLALYGAYSSALQENLEEFVEQGYLQEEIVSSGTSDYSTSKFTSKEKCRAVLRIFGDVEQPAWSKLLIDLNQRSTRDLEATSTIMYLRRVAVREEVLQERFEILKPHLKDVFAEAKKLADRLKESFADA